MGYEALKRFQIGYEATKGTAVAATRKMIGRGYVRQNNVIHMPEDEERGNFIGRYRSALAGQGVDWGFEGNALYEDLIDWLSMAVKGDVAPTQQALTTAWLWTFAPTVDATAPTVKSATIECGDDTECREAEYAMARSLTISGSLESALKVRVEGFARKLTVAAFTAALADRAVVDVMAPHGAVYLDALGGVMGATELSDTLIDFSWKLEPGFMPSKRMNGNAYFAKHGFGRRKLDLDLTFEHTAGAAVLRDALDTQTGKLLRIKFVGPTISGAYANTLTLDQPVKITGVSELGEQDGISTIKLQCKAFLDATYAKDFEAAVIAARATL